MLAPPSHQREKLLLQEVCPRDGLQNEQTILDPADRAHLISLLCDAGLRRLQIGAFVNPRVTPQMAGTDRVWEVLPRRPDVRYSALVLSPKGLDQAIASGVPHVEVYVSASETHSRKNSNAGVDKALRDATAMIANALEQGLTVTAGVMCAFGCFYEGAVAVSEVIRIAERLIDKRPTEIGLADTTGMADPQAVRNMLRALGDIAPVDAIALHLHDTRGLALANLRAGIEMGVRRFDSSLGGLGGCPFIPGAAGNIATEQVIEAAQASGLDAGVDLERLILARRELERLLGRRLR
jgi:hydroxymethylglutaryl-CoA lyase